MYVQDQSLFRADREIKKRIIVVNDQWSTMLGQLWLLIFFNPGVVYSIDFYGMLPDFYELLAKLLMFRRRIFVNKVGFQSMESRPCGLFCLFFSYYL